MCFLVQMALMINHRKTCFQLAPFCIALIVLVALQIMGFCTFFEAKWLLPMAAFFFHSFGREALG